MRMSGPRRNRCYQYGGYAAIGGSGDIGMASTPRLDNDASGDTVVVFPSRAGQ